MLALLSVRARFNDPDMWWHLKMGQIVWTTHTIPTTDIFSFTTQHHAMVPHEWLGQLLIFAAYQFAGMSGLMLWLCCFTGAIVIAGYALCSLYSGNAKVAFLGALVIWMFATIGYSIRPQMVGYLFLIFELLLIHLGRSRSPYWFLGLPPLFALWINCHGTFFLGLVVAVVYALSSFVDFHLGSLAAIRWDLRLRRMLILAMTLSFLALFLNPVGYKQVVYPLDAMFNQKAILANVQEYLPLNLTSERGILLLVVTATILLLAIIRHSELYLDELILLFIGIWLAASHNRLLFACGILAAPTLSRMLSRSWESYDHENDRIWPNAVLIGLTIAVAWIAFPSPRNLTAQIEAKSPVKAVEFIKAQNLSGPMLNDFTFGGYLLWELPEHPTFVDGRADVFDATGVLQEFGNWANLNSDPNELPDSYHIQFCLLSSGMPVARVLPLLKTWKIVYSDDLSVILVRAPTTPAK